MRASSAARPGGQFSRAMVELIRERDGHRCVGCGTTQDLTTQHRIARGMGGTGRGGDLALVIASPVNGLTLCGSGTTGCHGWAERNRAAAARLGWSVSRIAASTAEAARELLETTPVLVLVAQRRRAVWWYLTGITHLLAPELPVDFRAFTPGDHPADEIMRQLSACCSQDLEAS